MAYFLCVIGMVLIIEGLPYLASPQGVKVLARQIDSMPTKTLQIIGLIATLVGIGIVYVGTSIGSM
ncbi:MAG: DUF2065 domain-containing protein [Deltaproteobacteria bacterium]|nr:DUF2065 domain-containing protein [Deltaproteobacteria bacterium]